MNKTPPLQWIELSRDNLRHNVERVRAYLDGNQRIAALLKANAYGHGLLPMARLYREAGVSPFMVHTLDEALALRRVYKKERVVLIGPAFAEQMEAAVRKNIEFIVYTFESLDALEKILERPSPPARVHVKVETGTYRQGVPLHDLERFIRRLKKIGPFELAGVSSHFANIEDTADTRYYRKQLGRFRDALALFEASGLTPFERHIACSAAVLLYPETHFDLVRPGIALYGYFSSPELAYALKMPDPLRPVLSWKTRIAQIKTVGKGERVGYGLTYQATRPTRLGILPVGYCDGYDRKLSNVGSCLVHGKRAYVRGRVCMNMTLVDLTDIPGCRVGDPVTLIGSDGSETVSADELAALTHTISYEILARLNPLIPKRIA